jgi:16S rRNA (guanine966-N2)-methyltransferase
MRVVAGTARGRRLQAPPGRGTRPTSDRVREAMFSMLTSMAAIEGATVVDLFAGSGALGIEALSRGARFVTFVDNEPGALGAIRTNLASLPEADGRTSVQRADAVAWARRSGASGVNWDLVLADPPYAWRGWDELLSALEPAARLVVAETGGAWDPPEGWVVARARRYGTTVVSVVRPRARGDQ